MEYHRTINLKQKRIKLGAIIFAAMELNIYQSLAGPKLRKLFLSIRVIRKIITALEIWGASG